MGLTGAQLNNNSSDACGIQSLVSSQDSFFCGDIGPNIVTLTVTDVNGNSSSCTSTVTVEDNVPPIALCRNITIQLDGAGSASIVAADVDNGSNDACSSVILTVTPNTFGCANTGGNTVTLTATDVYGNASSCNANVFVEDTIRPIAVCQDVDRSIELSRKWKRHYRSG